MVSYRWAWVIRLPSWEGSPIPNLMEMINHLLDLNDRKTPGDQFPSCHELAKKFGLEFKWVVSIGFALRTDVVYPEDMSSYGKGEAERKFNWIVNRYPKMKGLMDQHVLIENLYGPGTTWFIRKHLAYQSPKVSGPGWVAIGDAVGFTNPLFSPGINANMGTSVFAAELTRPYLAAKDPIARMKVSQKYEKYCEKRIPGLNRMNVFNYLCMRSPKLGPLGPLWQYLVGTGNPNWQRIRSFVFGNVSEMLMGWDWGAHEEEYVDFVNQAIVLLDGPPSEPSAETVTAVLKLSDISVKSAIASGKYKNRWAGLLRWYDDDLEFCEDKNWKDVLSRRCKQCGNWRILREDLLKCAVCGGLASLDESKKVLVESRTAVPDKVILSLR